MKVYFLALEIAGAEDVVFSSARFFRNWTKLYRYHWIIWRNIY